MAEKSDIDATKRARREFNKHHIDITRADLRVMHGVMHLRGMVQADRGASFDDLRIECERIGRIIRQLPGIRDVVIDVQYRQ